MIKFETYISYIEGVLRDTTNELFNNSSDPDIFDVKSPNYGKPYIETPFKFKSFSNAGEFKRSKYLGDDPLEVVSVYLDNGITRDTSSNMKTYLQDIQIEFLVFEDNFPDFNVILNRISEEYKNKIITIDSKQAIMMIELSHDQPERIEIQAEHRLLTKMNITVIIYDSYFITNDFSLSISGEDIPFSSLLISRNVETIADGRKMIDQKFLQNTSGCAIGYSGPFMDTPVIKQIIKDISKAGSFSEIYHITIKNPDYDDLVLVDGDFIFKTGKITMQFSSVVLYEAQFIPASDLK